MRDYSTLAIMSTITEIEGQLEAYIAGKGRAIIWSIHDRLRPGPEGVHPILNGDFLTVYDEKGENIWSGIIDLDFEICRRANPDDPGKMEQELLGYRVHGMQKYVTPATWLRMFLDKRKAYLRRFRITPAGRVEQRAKLR